MRTVLFWDTLSFIYVFYEALDTYSLWPSSKGFGYLWIVSTLMKIFSYDKEIGMESMGQSSKEEGRKSQITPFHLSILGGGRGREWQAKEINILVFGNFISGQSVVNEGSTCCFWRGLLFGFKIIWDLTLVPHFLRYRWNKIHKTNKKMDKCYLTQPRGWYRGTTSVGSMV